MDHLVYNIWRLSNAPLSAYLTSWTTCGIMWVKQVVRMTPPAKHERHETNIRPRRALFRRRFAAPTPPPASSSATAAASEAAAEAAAMHRMAMVGSMPATSEMAPRSTIAITFVVVNSIFLGSAVALLQREGMNQMNAQPASD